MSTLKQKIKSLLPRLAAIPVSAPAPVAIGVLDQYLHSAPSAQNSLDIFKGQWSSKLPEKYGLIAGGAALFEDSRITWLAEQIGGLQGKTVLELGPLEAGHTYMLEQLGASAVTGVEANIQAYLKCLIVKEIIGLKAHFLLGDMNAYMEQSAVRFDVCVASGVLYHQQDPLHTLEMLTKMSDTLLLWTHYYDAKLINEKGISRFFSQATIKNGFAYHKRYYHEALEWNGFCGGGAAFANWMERDAILNKLTTLGLSDIKITLDHPNHPNGPAFVVLARRPQA